MNNTGVFSTLTSKGIEFSCFVGNIIETEVDAIAISCDPAYSLDVGLGKALRLAGGLNFMKNVESKKKTNSTKGILTIPANNCGKIKAQTVLLAPIRNSDRSIMDVFYENIIMKAKELNVSSLAIPILGCGSFLLNPAEAVQALMHALIRVNMGTIKKMKFVDLNANTIKYLSGKLNEAYTANQFNADKKCSNPKKALKRSLKNDKEPQSSKKSPGKASFNEEDSSEVDDTFSLSESNSPFTNSSDESNSDGDEDEIIEIPTTSNKHSTIFVGKNNDNSKPWTYVPVSGLLRKYKRKSISDKGKEKTKDKRESLLNQPCSICLSELLLKSNSKLSNSGYANVVKLKRCEHLFHEECIEAAFNVKKQCPLCMEWYCVATGNQPKNATMTVQLISGKISGFPDANGYHLITYNVPAGIQTQEHIRPGIPYSSTTRYAYLPNTREGSIILKMLQLAFERCLIFTIGDSNTTGQKNVPVWNGIHHKSRPDGGPQNYGYPDDDYFERVTLELANFGIHKTMVD